MLWQHINMVLIVLNAYILPVTNYCRCYFNAKVHYLLLTYCLKVKILPRFRPVLIAVSSQVT